jgi:hypothetical protein
VVARFGNECSVAPAPLTGLLSRTAARVAGAAAGTAFVGTALGAAFGVAVFAAAAGFAGSDFLSFLFLSAAA